MLLLLRRLLRLKLLLLLLHTPPLLRRQPRQPRAELLGSRLLLLGTESADQPVTLLKPGILSLLRLLLLLLLLLRLVDMGVAW